MNKEKWLKLKNWGLFLAGACLMIFSYSRQNDNRRSPNRMYADGERKYSQEHPYPIVIEEDVPEISSGTQ